MVIGIISDTHGLLRPEATDFLVGCDHILHAGDVGKVDILDQLRDIAPLTAIRGNIDKGPLWADLLPETEAVELAGHWVYLVHSLEDLDIDPAGAGMNVVVSGHTHKAHIHEKDNVLYLNPGSAGPRRFSLPVTIAKMTIQDEALVPEISTLLSW